MQLQRSHCYLHVLEWLEVAKRDKSIVIYMHQSNWRSPKSMKPCCINAPWSDMISLISTNLLLCKRFGAAWVYWNRRICKYLHASERVNVTLINKSIPICMHRSDCRSLRSPNLALSTRIRATWGHWNQRIYCCLLASEGLEFTKVNESVV